MSRERMIELQMKVFKLKGGSFALLPRANVYVSPEEWKEIDKLEEEIEEIRKSLWYNRLSLPEYEAKLLSALPEYEVC